MAPNHQPTETTTIGRIALLLEGIAIIVGDPLIAVPGDPLHTRSFIPDWLRAGLRNDVGNLLIVEKSRGL